MKITKVTPVLETDEIKEISNYRPISVLPCFSVILERIMHHRLCSYLVNEKKNYFRSKSASKKVISQSTPLLSWLIKFMNHLKMAIIHLGCLLISRAFDTIDHATLSKKLENYGIKDTNLAWFRSSLTNRKQYIQITNDSKSNLQNTTCGVPQGSLFRLLDFLVYLNDLPSSSKI